jgi:hypothetical protein
MAYGQTDEYGYARLHSLVMRRVMSKRTQPAVVRALVDGEVIEPPAPYCAGLRSKGYRLTRAYLTERFKLVPAEDVHLIARVRRELERMRQDQNDRWLPIHHDLNRLQQCLTILPEADSILDRLKPEARLCQHVLIEDIRNRNAKFTVSSTGRCFNLITGLKRELRSALRLAGEPIRGVDIRCAQPALLADLMLLSDGKNVPTYKRTHIVPFHGLGAGRSPRLPSSAPPKIEKDFQWFKELVVSGGLYEELIRLCEVEGVGLKDEPRDQVKLSLMRDVFAKKGSYPCKFAGVVARSFPSVYRFVKWVNRKNHGELIRALQRMESRLVIENVSPRLAGKIPFVTLHDAIYSRVRDTQIVVDAFHETFEELGLRLVVKAE